MTGSPARRMLPYGRQAIDEADVAAVVDVLRGDFLTTGPVVERFEAALSQAVGANEAMACNSGTSALYLVSRALDIDAGNAVIVPSQTFLATASAPHLAGAEVVFADVDPETGLMRPEDLDEAIARAAARFPTKHLGAAFVVHLNGQSADMPGLHRVAAKHGLTLIEDACHAIGGLTRRAEEPEADGRDRRVGDCSWSTAAVFSFHPVKTIAMGEGGAVTTNDPALAERMRRLHNHGMVRMADHWEVREQGFAPDGAPNPWYYELQEPSLNFRAPDILCALGLSQLAKLDRFVAERQRLFAQYRTGLSALRVPVKPPAEVEWGRPAWHLCAARIDYASCGLARADVMRHLHADSIGTQVHYIPLHQQPYWVKRYGRCDLPGAEAYYKATLSLPLHVGMTDADIDRVMTALKSSIS